MKGLFVLSYICFISVSSGYYLGAQKCTYGPSYWCASIKEAKECSAIDHCIERQWPHAKIAKDDDIVCRVCEDVIVEARDAISKEDFLENLVNSWEAGCKLLPVDSLIEECMDLGEEYIPEIVALIKSELEPQTVCSAIGLCNAHRIDMILKEHNIPKPAKIISPKSEAQHPQPGDCEDCQKYLSDMKRIVKDHSRDELLDHLRAICTQLSTYSDACYALVTINNDNIYDFIVNDLNPDDVCHLFDMCEDNLDSRLISAHTGDKNCDFCARLSDSVRQKLSFNTSLQVYSTTLQTLCTQTGKFSRDCLYLAYEFGEKSYEYLRDYFNPVSACQVMGICQNDEHRARPVWSILPPAAAPSAPVPAAALAPAPEPISEASSKKIEPMLVGRDETNSYRPEPRPEIQVAGQSGLISGSDQECEFCKMVVVYLESSLSNPQMIDEIKKDLKMACADLPVSEDEIQTCDDYVDAYTAVIITLVKQYLKPGLVCTELDFCPKYSSSISNCKQCEQFALTLYRNPSDNLLKKTALHTLQKECKKTRDGTHRECIRRVNEMAEQVSLDLSGGHSPRVVCMGQCLQSSLSTLRLAFNPQVSPLLSPRNMLPLGMVGNSLLGSENDFEKMPKSQECAHCRRVVGYLMDKVAVDLDKLSRENSLMEPFNDDVRMLYEETLLRKFCVNQCPKDQVPKLEDTAPKEEDIAPEEKDIVCDICSATFKELKDILNDKKIEDMTEGDLEDACRMVSIKELRQACIDFVRQNTPIVMHALAADVAPREICESIALCSIAPPQPKAKPSTSCVLCEYVISTIRSMIKDNETNIEEKVRHALESVCLILPSSIMQECTEFVDQYADQIVKVFIIGVDPEEICQELGLCKPTLLADHLPTAYAVVPRPKRSVQSSAECVLCTALQKIHKTDDAQGSLKNAHCNSMDATEIQYEMTAEKCHRIRIELETSEDPDSHCSRCNPANRRGLVGGSSCTFGPSYWCQTRTHQFSCAGRLLPACQN